MKLCVGAVSPRVIEEAAKLGVHQIIASRRQVDIDGGYTGFDQRKLVQRVKELSDGVTHVVRDHGGPFQGGSTDDGIESFNADVAAGFDGLHIDVCMLPREEQQDVLVQLIKMYRGHAFIQVGGERDDQAWLETLLTTALHHITPAYAVVDLGGYIHADRQRGQHFMSPDEVYDITQRYNALSVDTVAHNMDWVGHRHQYEGALDAINIAPEYGAVEVDAILTILTPDAARNMLDYAYTSAKWMRWFGDGEGTWMERAKCALRYLMHTDPYARETIALNDNQELFVRSVIRDAIICG